MEIGQNTCLRFTQEEIKKAHLSIPGWTDLSWTNGLCRDQKRASQDSNAPRDEKGNLKLPYRGYDEKKCLRSYSFHLENCGLASKEKWLLFGARNLGNNLRIIGYSPQRYPEPLLQLCGEDADHSFRKYFCLCCLDDNQLTMEDIDFYGSHPDYPPPRSNMILTWLVSGIPLVWNGKISTLAEIIPHEYDLGHVWRIPGPNGERTYASQEMEELTELWIEFAADDPKEQMRKVVEFVERKGWPREKHYLHSAIGLTENEDHIILVMRHGTFEDVGESLIRAGVWRAIELDQGGSCCLMMGGALDFFPGRVISASHYFRQKALSLVILELNDLAIVENSNLID